jgi:hypothetical protein
LAEQNRKSSRSKASLTRHPLFPAIVALWFGALFSLGGLAVRISTIESIGRATHLDSVLSAAAPPLGLTARILLVLFMAAIGGVIGAIVARRIASAGRPAQQPRRRQWKAEAEEASVRAATFAAPESVVQVPADSGRRRSLALADDLPRRDFTELAPLPGGGPQILDLAAVDLDGLVIAPSLPGAPAEAYAPQSEPDTFVLQDEDEVAAADTLAEMRQGIAPEAASFEMAPAEPGSEENTIAADVVVEHAPYTAAPGHMLAHDHTLAHESPRPRFAPPRGSAAERIAGTDLDVLSNVELIERLALSLQRRRAAAPVAVAPISAEPLIAEHVESIWREKDDAAADGHAVAAPAPGALHEAPLAPIPAAFRPIGFDADDDFEFDGGDQLSGFVPPRRFSMPAAFAEDIGQDEDIGEPVIDHDGPVLTPLVTGDELDEAEEDAAQEEAELDQARYGSLLDGGRTAPVRQQFGRAAPLDQNPDGFTPRPFSAADYAAPLATEAEPREPEIRGDFVPLRRFDSPARASFEPAERTIQAVHASDPEDTEQALRSALASLQRMSGAA